MGGLTVKALRPWFLAAAVGVAALSFLSPPAAATPTAATSSATATSSECGQILTDVYWAFHWCGLGDTDACQYLDDGYWVGAVIVSCLGPFCGLFVL
jgi:hypothetical protein